MSRENVEILRGAVQAFDRGDDDEWIAAWHPAAELYDFTELPDVPQPYRGHDGIRRWAANVRSVLGDFRMAPHAFTPVGDAVLMEVEVRGVGEQSGVPVAMVVYVLAWFRGDKIARTRAFLDRPNALEAVGFEE
jgi:ketosteroid isomerase-like protein